MSLSSEEKQKCSKLWKWATGIDEPEEKWNKEAAELLAQMYAEILTCTKLLNYVPRPAGRPTYGWLLKQAFDALCRDLLTSKHKVYTACKNTAVFLCREPIEEKLMGL